MIDIQLLETPLSVDACRGFVVSDEAGAVVEFVGTVRRHTKGKTVVRLEFEAYEAMALSEMRKIAEKTLAEYAVLRISIHHRTGVLDIGEIPVVIAVSAAHRAAAFVACQYCIDTLKQTVPIWKKEVFDSGEVWVAAHP